MPVANKDKQTQPALAHVCGHTYTHKLEQTEKALRLFPYKQKENPRKPPLSTLLRLHAMAFPGL